MRDPVKPDRRAQQRAETERRLVVSASALFVERGYALTTLADIAQHADVAPRTLYLHFQTKADLLLRCVGVAIAGDFEPIALADRPAMALAMDAPSLDERIEHMATLTASLMEQAGPLLAVAFQAAPSEPVIEAAATAGRAATAASMREFWHRIHHEGLLSGAVDLEWLTDTATLMAHAETYLLMRRMPGWNEARYRDWLITTWHRLAASSTDVGDRPTTTR